MKAEKVEFEKGRLEKSTERSLSESFRAQNPEKFSKRIWLIAGAAALGVAVALALYRSSLIKVSLPGRGVI